jgi:hypothetical protein
MSEDLHTESMRGWTSGGQRLADVADAPFDDTDGRGEINGPEDIEPGYDYDTDSASVRQSLRMARYMERTAPAARR